MLSASVWTFVCERLISCPIFSGGNPCRQELRKTVQESMCTKTACVAKEKEKAAPRGPSCIITYYSFHIYSLVVLYFFFRLGAFIALPLLTLPPLFSPPPIVLSNPTNGVFSSHRCSFFKLTDSPPVLHTIAPDQENNEAKMSTEQLSQTKSNPCTQRGAS